MLREDTATPQQQVDLYSTLILALPEGDISIIKNITQTDKSCGVAAWAALVDHCNDDGVYRLSELLQDMETAQADGESSVKYMNRLVRLQLQLARVGEDVQDLRVIMYFVNSFRNEYHSITDTWEIHRLCMDAAKRDIRQKGMRIESGAQSRAELRRPRLLHRLMMMHRLGF
jgi:hypothetical protein